IVCHVEVNVRELRAAECVWRIAAGIVRLDCLARCESHQRSLKILGVETLPCRGAQPGEVTIEGLGIANSQVFENGLQAQRLREPGVLRPKSSQWSEQGSPQRPRKGLANRRLFLVRDVAECVTAKALVSTIAGQCNGNRPARHLAYVPGWYCARVGKRLVEMMSDSRQHFRGVGPHDELVVVGPEVLCDRSCDSSLAEFFLLETDRVGDDRTRAMHRLGHCGNDERRIESAR